MLSRADVEYITANFVPLDELCRRSGESAPAIRAEVAAGRLPRPTYVLEDGAEMVPADYFSLAADAGSLDALREHFVDRYSAAAALEPERLDAPEDEWRAYLSGEYGACLKEVTPENIARKSALVARIDALLRKPRQQEDIWRTRLREAV